MAAWMQFKPHCDAWLEPNSAGYVGVGRYSLRTSAEPFRWADDTYISGFVYFRGELELLWPHNFGPGNKCIFSYRDQGLLHTLPVLIDGQNYAFTRDGAVIKSVSFRSGSESSCATSACQLIDQAELPFLDAIATGDTTARLIYSDWLEERGRVKEAEFQRRMAAC